MEDFNEDNGPRFMLCSLKAAGVGITLVRANVVFILSPWWNSSEEEQAMDRCHRIGMFPKVHMAVVTFVNHR